MILRAACVDSGGHYTQQVYNYCRARAGRKIFAIKGVGGEGKPIVGRPSKNNIGKVRLFAVGSDTAKELVYSRLRIEEPGAGYCHFPSRDDEYFKQLTAERLVIRYVRGHAKRVWTKIRNRNEALDVRCYALAAYSILGVNVNTIAAKMAEKRASDPKDVADVSLNRQQTARRAPPRRGGFVNGWR